MTHSTFSYQQYAYEEPTNSIPRKSNKTKEEQLTLGQKSLKYQIHKFVPNWLLHHKIPKHTIVASWPRVIVVSECQWPFFSPSCHCPSPVTVLPPWNGHCVASLSSATAWLTAATVDCAFVHVVCGIVMKRGKANI